MIEKFTSLSKIFSFRLWRSRSLRAFDRIRGLDFEVIVNPEEVGLNPLTSFRSSPSGNRFLISVLHAMRITPEDRIIDIGCGKGSAMRVMCKFPFSRISGIELSDVLAGIAKNNFYRIVRKVDIYNGDASNFLGYRDFNIFYFYNPFPAEVMKITIDKILNSYAGDRSEIVIIYNNPICNDVLVNAGFKCHAKFPDEWGNGIFLYSNRLVGDSRLNRLINHS